MSGVCDLPVICTRGSRGDGCVHSVCVISQSYVLVGVEVMAVFTLCV